MFVFATTIVFCVQAQTLNALRALLYTTNMSTSNPFAHTHTHTLSLCLCLSLSFHPLPSSMRVGAAAKVQGLEKERDALHQQLNASQKTCRELQQKYTAIEGQRDGMKAERDQMRRERDAMKAERDAMKQRLDAALLWTGVCVCVCDA